MTGYFSELVEQSVSRATESTLSVLGITNPTLRNHLSHLMSGESSNKESFLAPPLFEHTFGWEFAKPEMADLSGELLSDAIVKALDDKSNGRYRFGSDFHPFEHQLNAWQTLLDDDPKSVVVTSGTGSGKTECFMVPVLEDLYKEYQQNKSPLMGVRALFLYPLNALINSQKERLDAWTKHFGSGIRYCLYNGNTENSEKKMRKAQEASPNHVLSRELMRREPAPILVTNGTMLEYMLVRQVDAPIIERSRQEKSLRWIVLDEAHTYVGSQAAELSLQLRRVLHAFGVEAKDVRFVATSATIAGDEATEQLTKYLSDLAGIDPKQIKIIGGRRVIPEIDFVEGTDESLEHLELINADGEWDKEEKKNNPEISSERFNALKNSRYAHTLRKVIVDSQRPLTLNEINTLVATELNQKELSQSELLRWLDLLTGTKPVKSAEAFLKLRAHFFQRMTNGLWSCIDKNCSCKNGTDLEKNWPFGYVYTSQRQKCECGAPVLELAFCTQCNEPHLLGHDQNGVLTQWNQKAGDEFSLQNDDISDEDEESCDIQELDERVKLPEIFASKIDEEHCYIPTRIGLEGQFATHDPQGYDLTLATTKDPLCSDCGFTGYNHGSPFRRAILGAPFYIANVVPTLLEYCPDFSDKDKKSEGPQSLPARGRRLITFTDSRQGTARLSVRMQQEAERSKLRGAVVEVLREKQLDQPVNMNQPKEGVTAKELLQQSETLRDLGMFGPAEELEKQAAAIDSGHKALELAHITWEDMVAELAKKREFKGAMFLYNRYLSPEVFNEHDGSYKLAEMLLFREFARRPKRQNSSETQGLVKINYVGLEKIKHCPKHWDQYGFSIQDWLDFIKVALDFFVRENNFLRLEDNGWLKWIGSHFSSKSLRNPDSDEFDEGRFKRWPLVRGSQRHRLVKLLTIASKIDCDNKQGQDIINDWLRAAWRDVTETARILVVDDNQFALDRRKLTFSFVEKVFICPVTNKLLDTTFRGFTPYLPRQIHDINKYQCNSVEYPNIWNIEARQYDYQNGLTHIREQVKSDPKVTSLREKNLWTDINDRAVEGGFYYRTAEHSAQQSSERLQSYEDLFKEGKINVLNCSTTMEMGVDIGGITAVVMNNVPPHPANYLQRAGRAGRSKESRAISYTLCKGNPHDQQVFDNPKWPFVTSIPAPYVERNSSRLVQRHVNSMLLSLFLNQVVGDTSKEKTSLNLEWFYLPEDNSICDHFLAWIESDASYWDADIMFLVRGTVLSQKSANLLRKNAAECIFKLKDRWFREFHYLENESINVDIESPYAYRLNMEKTRLTNEFLLKEFAAKAFLPGYGFPTDVVTFDNNNIEDFLRDKKRKRTPKEEREDNSSRFRGLPSRNLAVALREYAPGAEIVLDGRVFRSGGVALHWHNVSFSGAKEAQKFDIAWRCDCCGQTGYVADVSASALNMKCTNPKCGASIKPYNILQVLQPAGFVSDFYRAPTNDISTQKFMPVQDAWVSVGEAIPVSLPNENMGYMLSTEEGTVFYHTSGENGTGYAICPSCGRSESMDKNGDCPSYFNPTIPHRPLRAVKKDKNSDENVGCDGSPYLMKNIHLGCHSKTDVFELVLKHPVRNEYIPDSPRGKIIAMTLSLALRKALAGILGISTSELGYSIRPAIVESGEPAKIIQLYDVISGGAGFASTAHYHIQTLLTEMVNNLHCSKCSHGCGECLLESDTRNDTDYIDSALALEWLGDDFEQFNTLPEELRDFSGGEYQPASVALTVRNLVNRGAKEAIFWLGNDISEWDLTHPNFKRALINYLTSDNIKVTLVLPQEEFEQDLTEELWFFKKIGARLAVGESSRPEIVAQLINDEQVVTIATSDSENIVPGENWHRKSSVVILTRNEQSQAYYEFNLKRSYSDPNQLFGTLEVDALLNGSLNHFGGAFWTLLLEHDEGLRKLLSEEQLMSISYSDRYIQTPASMLLIAEIINALCKYKSEISSITINTLYQEKERMGKCLHHDWQDKDEFVEGYKKWLEYLSSTDTTVVCHMNRRDIPHRRQLILAFSSGRKVSLKFDQGVGYWQLYEPNSHYSTVLHNFNSDIDIQLGSLQKLQKSLSVRNSEDWSTDVTYQEI